MNVLTPAMLLVASAALVTFTALASTLDPPVVLDSRDMLVIAIGLAGLAFGAMATRRFIRIQHVLAAAH
ncbi:MAG: hypothetical protein J0I77_02065 [Rudaea sp.]|uniref:hypothetical protein n=1 Tax=unclassified Rudaea TaxID=2627037 RepID=UPI0010F61B5B|nr:MULTISPECIES: hypothetical protein [unclassified Rudaea]MBN8884481.1 hypothetical protein [Rudaea sp.]